MEKENLQNKILEMNLMENRLKQLDQQLNMIEQQLVEDEKLEEYLTELKSSPKSGAIFPLGGGIFVKGSLEKVDTVLVNIGSKILVEKSVDDAKKLIEKRKNKLNVAKVDLGNHIREIMQSMAGLENGLKS